MRNKLREMGTTPHGDGVVSCATILSAPKQRHLPMKLAKILTGFVALLPLLDLTATPEFTINGGTLTAVELNGETEVTIPDGVTIIGYQAFQGCWELQSVTIPASVTVIVNAAFNDCRQMESVEFKGNAPSCNSLFYDVPNGCEVVVPRDSTGWYVNEGELWRGLVLRYAPKIKVKWEIVNGELIGVELNGQTDIRIPSSVTRIRSHVFQGCWDLKRVTLSDSVTHIMSDAFVDCHSLTNITIGACVEMIEHNAFRNCDSLSSFVVPISNPFFLSDAGLILTKDSCQLVVVPGGLLDVMIPDGVRIVRGDAFCDCKHLTRVTIPASVTAVEAGAFLGCNGLRTIVVDEQNLIYKYQNGLLLSKDGMTLFMSVNGVSMIPAGVTEIANGAFLGRSDLKSVTIPNSITNIGERAFVGCSGLTSVTIPGRVTSIGDYAFYNCRGLTSVTFAGDAPMVGYAFCGVATGCTACVKRTASGWPAEGANWNGVTIAYYGASSEKAVIEAETDGYALTANAGETLTENDVTFTAVIGGTLVDATKGYDVKVAADGKSAVARLKTPIFGAVAVAEDENPPAFDGSDPSGALVVVDENELAAKPTAKNGEEVGALPVAAVPGLYYQAAWGDDIGNLTTGARVQAATDTLYLGVIKQAGAQGFYRVTVSE